MAESETKADIDDLLEETSRTFALCIPQLPEPTEREVGIAYLLFRIADTFEDAAVWPRQRRLDALDDFSDLLDDPDPGAAHRHAEQWLDDPPSDHEGYLDLLKATPQVLTAFTQLDEEAQAIITKHVQRTIQRMADFVRRADESGYLELKTLDDLREYCYAVAGIVGEMLTDSFLLRRPPLEEIRPYLTKRAPLFGEGLQLTNILKDANVDEAEGRSFLPDGVDRKAVFELARKGLDAAAEYTLALQKAGAARGIVAFNALPLRLAIGTLDRVEEEGPGAKLSRSEVFTTIGRMHYNLRVGKPAVDHPAWERPLEHFQQAGDPTVQDSPVTS